MSKKNNTKVSKERKQILSQIRKYLRRGDQTRIYNELDTTKNYVGDVLYGRVPADAPKAKKILALAIEISKQNKEEDEAFLQSAKGLYTTTDTHEN